MFKPTVIFRAVRVAGLSYLLLSSSLIPTAFAQSGQPQQQQQRANPVEPENAIAGSGVDASGGKIVGAPRRPIIITAGKPNVWSLEQAHYLLARMRSESLSLQSKTPTDDDLNPNAVSGSRLNSLKTSLDVGASFEAATGFNNDIAAQTTRYNLTRRPELEGRRDQLYLDLDKVTGDLAVLKVQRERMNADQTITDADKRLKDAEIDGKTAQQAVVKERITQTNEELGKLTATSGTVAAPTPPEAFDKDRMSLSLLEKLSGAQAEGIKDMLKQDTRLGASTVLDNHIGMQYELIAKQLTLLRDEVGPGQRLIFLELPQSIYTTPGRADNKIAQVWWHVDGYVKVNEDVRRLSDLNRAKARLKVELMPAHSGEYARLVKDIDLMIEELARRQIARIVAESQRVIQGGAEKETDLLAQLDYLKRDQQNTGSNAYKQGAPGLTYVSTDKSSQADASHDGADIVRTVDLIPRQSSLNVNDIQNTVKTNRFAGAFTTLFGFGAKGSYQRQQELYEQYLHQDVYASGFGKGEDTFGWTFGPLPGTKRLAPGLRTTYAILIVPEDAQALQLRARGCYFPSKELAPQNFWDTQNVDWQRPEMVARRRCDQAASTFTIVIPGTRGDSFWVNGIKYRRVRPGERSVVYIDGEDFSAQTGVLIDGVALRPTVGVAQPALIRSASGSAEAREAGISGSYEIINSRQIAVAFNMPSAYKGTPTISLIAPGRGRVLNDLRLRINGLDGRTLDEMPPMIAADVEAQALTITRIEIVNAAGAQTQMKAYLTGTKFNESKDKIFVNANEMAPGDKKLLAPGIYQLTFNLPREEKLNVTIVQDEKEYASHTINNPLHLKISQATIMANDLDKKPATLTIKVEGTGFKSTLLSGAEEVEQWVMRYVSPTEVIFKITAPKRNDYMILSLTDVTSNISVSTTVPRPATPAPPAAPTSTPRNNGAPRETNEPDKQ
jgi:hypothetical protein